MTVEVKRRRALGLIGAAGLAALATGCAPRVEGQATSGWDVMGAQREGEVVVYVNTGVYGPVAEGFRKRFPKIKLTMVEVAARPLQARVMAETDSGAPVADVAWSSSMDIQVKLINDGYAQTYRSPEARHLPAWAVWRDQGFGVTAEPIVFAYNKRLLKEEDVPRSHAALLAALRDDPARWRGRIAMYDPEKSGVGFLYLSSDTLVYPDAWALYDALAASDPGLYVPGAPILASVTSGKHLLAYDMNRSYADWWARGQGPDIGYVVPGDYYLSIARVAFITRAAPHPKAARLFLDYLMSEEGQRRLAQARLTPIREGLGAAPPPGGRPIRVGPALLANFDQGRRADMLARWRRARGDRD